MIKSHDFLHAVPGQMATRFDLGTHLFASEGSINAHNTYCDPRKIRSVKTLEKSLCYNAHYPVDIRGRKTADNGRTNHRWTLNLGACIECESPCEYGMERLRRLKIHELLELGCGADCLTCPEPCRARCPAKSGWGLTSLRRTRSLLHAIPAPTRERSEASRRWKASSATTPATRWTYAGGKRRITGGRTNGGR